MSNMTSVGVSDLPREIWGLITTFLPQYALRRLNQCSHYLRSIVSPSLDVHLPANYSRSPFWKMYLSLRLWPQNVYLDSLTHVTSICTARFQARGLSAVQQLRHLQIYNRFTGDWRTVLIASTLTRLEYLDVGAYHLTIDWPLFTRLTHFRSDASKFQEGEKLPSSLRSLHVRNLPEELNPLTHLSLLESLYCHEGVLFDQRILLDVNHSFISRLEKAFPRLQWLGLPGLDGDFPSSPSPLALTHLKCVEFPLSRSAISYFPRLVSIESDYFSEAFPPHLEKLSVLEPLVDDDDIVLPKTLKYLHIAGSLPPLETLTNLIHLELDIWLPTFGFDSVCMLPRLKHLEMTAFRKAVLSQVCETLLELSQITSLEFFAFSMQGSTASLRQAFHINPAMGDSFLQLPRLECVRWYNKSYVPGDIRAIRSGIKPQTSKEPASKRPKK